MHKDITYVKDHFHIHKLLNDQTLLLMLESLHRLCKTEKSMSSNVFLLNNNTVPEKLIGGFKK